MFTRPSLTVEPLFGQSGSGVIKPKLSRGQNGTQAISLIVVQPSVIAAETASDDDLDPAYASLNYQLDALLRSVTIRDGH